MPRSTGAGAAGRPIRFELSHGGAVRHVTVDAPPGCRAVRSAARSRDDGAVRREASGTIGVRFFERYDDDETAVIVAHELAHTILRHRARLAAAGVKAGCSARSGATRGSASRPNTGGRCAGRRAALQCRLRSRIGGAILARARRRHRRRPVPQPDASRDEAARGGDGRDGARDTARRGAAPMRRRCWRRVTTRWNRAIGGSAEPDATGRRNVVRFTICPLMRTPTRTTILQNVTANNQFFCHINAIFFKICVSAGFSPTEKSPSISALLTP